MSCVLRISGPKLDELLAGVSLKPYRIEKGCAHFAVSDRGFDDFPGQLRDAMAFLAGNVVEVTSLVHSEEMAGVLDFAVEVRNEGFQFREFPPTLVQQAGATRLGLALSLYPADSS